LKHSQATVDAVAIDMSPAYISAVMKHLPGAVIVFDHFHVVKLFNDKLSDLRRDLYREAKDQLRGSLPAHGTPVRPSASGEACLGRLFPRWESGTCKPDR
jgi:transposase